MKRSPTQTPAHTEICRERRRFPARGSPTLNQSAQEESGSDSGSDSGLLERRGVFQLGAVRLRPLGEESERCSRCLLGFKLDRFPEQKRKLAVGEKMPPKKQIGHSHILYGHAIGGTLNSEQGVLIHRFCAIRGHSYLTY